MNDLDGRHVLVTGANSGIGKETARGLAKRGARVTLAGRSEEKTRAAIADIAGTVPTADLGFLHLDLGDFTSVRHAAEEFLSRGEPLDGLVNNAGLAGAKGMTASGFELAFGTNHLGPFLFTNLLLDLIKRSSAGRIVNVSSDAHYQVKSIDWDAVRRPTSGTIGMGAYAFSKLANVLHAQELARRLDGTNVTTYSLHPGVVGTEIWRGLPRPIAAIVKRFMLTTEDGAKTSLHCAASPEAGAESGLFYQKSKPADPNPIATPKLGAELWERSEAWVTGV